MRTPLTVATGLVLLAGVVVGVTTTAASADDAPAVQPIRVEAPPVPGAVAEVEPVVPVVPDLPAPAADPQQAPEQQQAPQQEQPRDPNGYVAPPPAGDDDDDDDGADDDDADDDGDD